MKTDAPIGDGDDCLEEETRAAVRGALQEQLAGCRTCQTLLDNLRQTIALLRRENMMPLPEGLHERLRETLRQRWDALYGSPAPSPPRSASPRSAPASRLRPTRAARLPARDRQPYDC